MTCEGWYTDGACTQKFLGITAQSRGEITLYSKLTSDRLEFGIDYYVIEDGKKQNVPLYMWDEFQEYPTRYKKGEATEVGALIDSIPITVKDLKAVINVSKWYTDEACTRAFTGITEDTRGDVSLYAKATTTRLEYAVSYYAVLDGQIQSVPQEFWVESGEYPTVYTQGAATTVSNLKAQYPEDGENEITVFGGWYTDMSCTKAFTGITAQTKEDLNLYACLFTANASTMRKITYKAVINDTTVTDVPQGMFAQGGNYPIAYYQGQSAILVDKLKNYTVREQSQVTRSYTFVAWYLDEACTVKFTGSVSGSTEDITLYAKVRLSVWSPNV